MAWLEILLGITLFTAIVVLLSMIVLAARSRLVPAGSVTLTINNERRVEARIGDRLLGALADAGINLPSACGGAGTCGLCRVTVADGSGVALPVERALFSRGEIRAGLRLACQQVVQQPLALELPDEILGVRQWTCSVAAVRQVGAFIKEIILDLPEGEAMDFRAGAFIQITCPPYRLDFTGIEIDDLAFEAEWEKFGLRRLHSATATPVTRAYSIASYPGERGRIILNIRLALPPPNVPDAPPGIVSSWLFGLRPGDAVAVAGPFGHFFAPESEAEMILIGGGVGMAPMRSHILDQLVRLQATRRISFWYGARSRSELFYVELFDRLQQEHPNFRWHVALSEPKPVDEWDGPIGFIHQVLLERYLKDHPAPEECEYFLCGPPMMSRAVLNMLDGLGVPPENIHFDDFGG